MVNIVRDDLSESQMQCDAAEKVGVGFREAPARSEENQSCEKSPARAALIAFRPIRRRSKSRAKQLSKRRGDSINGPASVCCCFF